MGIILTLRRRASRRWLWVLLAPVAFLGACSSDNGDVGGDAGSSRPVVVASNSILGNVVENLASNHVDVRVVLPAGADPHTFSPAPRDIAAISGASAIVINGGGLEEGAVADAIDAARGDGVPVFAAIDAVEPLRLGPGSDDPIDPHFFTDASRMATAAERIVGFIAAEVDGIDVELMRAEAQPYLQELVSLDGILRQMSGELSADRRVLVTGHDVLRYFADRYEFEVAGVLVSGGSDEAQPDPATLASIADLLRSRAIPAIFVDAEEESDPIAEAVAAEAGGVAVVPLAVEALAAEGPASTYTGMMLEAARLISEALEGPAKAEGDTSG